MQNINVLKSLGSFLILFFAIAAVAQQPAGVIKTADGLIVYPDTRLSGNTLAIRLQVINDHIIRVTAVPSHVFPQIKSLVVLPQNPGRGKWMADYNENNAVLKTAFVTAVVQRNTGSVTFLDADGKKLLQERAYNGRLFSQAVFEGQPGYAMQQVFETAADDAYYGLGQHQEDQFNYKGQQVLFFQNNTEVAVPFLLSNKNYGLLWDNYSITKFGDVREFLPLSSLKLFSKRGEEGWLTASYSNNRNKKDSVAFEKAESVINYPYLGDTKTGLPADFNIQNGVITWEGSIVSGFTGTHKFRLTYAGYTKVWIDGKLWMDKWRQAWNPGSAVLNVPLEQDRKYNIRIEWIPDGGESYLSMKWLPPVPGQDVNAYAFASEAGKQLDYYFVYGDNMDSVISGYRKLTGKAPIVPRWAMGFWQSRERYKTQDEVLQTVAAFRKRKIPLDNIVLDWFYWKENEWGSQDFDPARFPDPAGMIKTLHEQYNTRLMISVWPKFYEGIPVYDTFNRNGWLYKRNIADRVRDWVGKGYTSTFYDVYNDDAKKAFWKLIHDKLYTKGIDAWWMDASEPDILSNAPPSRRREQMTPTAIGLAAEYMNTYGLENAKVIYKGQRAADTTKRVFLLTRSGFAGSQHYGATIWSGDIASRWEDMKSQIYAGVNFSMSGLPYWTMDIGGFSVERRYENAKGEDLEEWRELNTRWYQFGAFVPLFRQHGQYPFREIFNIAPEGHRAYQSMLYYNRLRYRLLPYLYTLAGMAYHNDYTLMRGLVMDFPNDRSVQLVGDQYLLGPSLLVNPVYNYKVTERTVYLPAGPGWYDFYSGKFEAGGRTISAAAPYERMPLYVKEGSVIPVGPSLQYTSEKKADTLTLYVYTGKDATFTLYEDEGTNYRYERGAYSNIPITWNEKEKRLTIGKRTGSFPGMLAQRFFRVVWITKDLPGSPDQDPGTIEAVPYNGASLQLTMMNKLQ